MRGRWTASALCLAMLATGFSPHDSWCYFPSTHCCVTNPPLAEAGFCFTARQDLCERVTRPDDCDRRYYPGEHFDRRCGEDDCAAFTRGMLQLRSTAADINALLARGDCEAAKQRLADAMHAVQDFVAHSNYCALSTTSKQIVHDAVCGDGDIAAACARIQLRSVGDRVTGPGQPVCSFLPCPGDPYQHDVSNHFHPTGCDISAAANFTRCLLDQIRTGVGITNWQQLQNDCRPDPCPTPLPPPQGEPDPSCDDHPLEGVTSWDPNAKLGQVGGGSQHYLRGGGAPLTYLIEFENDSSASAPARHVVVSDVLDTTVFDHRSVVFGSVVIGDHILTGGLADTAITAELDLRPSRDAIVRISARLENAPVRITWDLMTLDPTTGLPTDDPLGGFLPQNKNPPAGQGSVAFNVALAGGAGSGAALTNSAVITFDANAPITTPVWRNVLDSVRPLAQVQALPDTTPADSVVVFWAGSDDVSGVAAVDIYVAQDGGSVVPWRLGVTESSAVFHGAMQHRYGFVALAQDTAGNHEDWDGLIEASTLLFDVTTAVLCSNAYAQGYPDSVVLGWQVAPGWRVARTERRRPQESVWKESENYITAEMGERYRVIDFDVRGGEVWWYRAVITNGADVAYGGEAFVEVPRAYEFGVHAVGSPGPNAELEMVVRGRGDLEISVFDVAGRRVGRKVMANSGAGVRRITVGEIATLPSGMYLCRVREAGEQRVARVMLIR